MLPQVLFSSESHLALSKQCNIILCQFSPVDALHQGKKKTQVQVNTVVCGLIELCVGQPTEL